MNSETFREQGRCGVEFCFFLVRVRHRADSLRRAREVRGERTEADLNEIELFYHDLDSFAALPSRCPRMYEAAGFVRYALQKDAGTAIFMSKPLH